MERCKADLFRKKLQDFFQAKTQRPSVCTNIRQQTARFFKNQIKTFKSKAFHTFIAGLCSRIWLRPVQPLRAQRLLEAADLEDQQGRRCHGLGRSTSTRDVNPTTGLETLKKFVRIIFSW